MIAIIRETFIWDIPEEEKEFKKYLYENLEASVSTTSEKAITSMQYIHICEKEEEND